MSHTFQPLLWAPELSRGSAPGAVGRAAWLSWQQERKPERKAIWNQHLDIPEGLSPCLRDKEIASSKVLF